MDELDTLNGLEGEEYAEAMEALILAKWINEAGE